MLNGTFYGWMSKEPAPLSTPGVSQNSGQFGCNWETLSDACKAPTIELVQLIVYVA